jgi:uncharacterized phage infection (PIP) family protein YhgE
MNTEWQRQQAEDRREQAEEGRQNTEKERNASENRRQAAEKQREVGEQLRDIRRTGDQLVAEYSARSLLTRIERLEEQLSQLGSRLESVETLLKAMHEQLQQLVNSNTCHIPAL